MQLNKKKTKVIVCSKTNSGRLNVNIDKEYIVEVQHFTYLLRKKYIRKQSQQNKYYLQDSTSKMNIPK